MPYANLEDRKRYMQRWWVANKIHIQEYRLKNAKKRSKQHKIWRLNNKNKRADDMRAWRKNPVNRLSSVIRSRVSNVLSGRIKAASNESLLGCSWIQLKKHLEDQFESWMTWENYGEWEIDHIKPCSSFDLSTEDNQRKCFSFKNLRPLRKLDNRRKGCHADCELR